MTAPLRVTHYMRHPRPNLFSIEKVYEQVRAFLPADIAVRRWACRRASQMMAARVADARAARSAQGDVNHITGDAHYLTWFTDPARNVLTIHDVESLERMRGPKRALFRLLWFTIPVRRSAAIVAISAATRDALARHVSLAGKRVEIIPNPVVADIARRTAPFDTVRPTILHIGTKANKNLERHVAALDALNVRLIVVGALSDAQRALLECSGLAWENRVQISDAELAATYAEADLLLFASLAEGFGLPVLEAQMAGIPVLTSDRSSLPEAAGDGALLVDPTSVEAIRAGVLRIVEDGALRDRLIAAGLTNVERFAPHAIAERYAALYRDVAREAAV